MAWVDLTGSSTPPCPRTYHSATLLGQQIVVYGGLSKEGLLDDVHAFDLAELTWSRISILASGHDNTPSPRCRHSAVAIRDKVYVFGGVRGGDGVYMLSRSVHSEGSMLWTRVRTRGRPPGPRFAHAAALHLGSMYVFGGRSAFQIFDDLFRLDVKRRAWSQVRTKGQMPPRSPTMYGLVSLAGELLVFGGAAPGVAWHLVPAHHSAAMGAADNEDHAVDVMTAAFAAQAITRWRRVVITEDHTHALSAPHPPPRAHVHVCCAAPSLGAQALGVRSARIYFLGGTELGTETGAASSPLWTVEALWAGDSGGGREFSMRWDLLHCGGNLPPASFCSGPKV